MTFKFGKLALDAVELGSRGNAVLGIRDSGKTYTATLLAERLFDAGIPFIAFDPIGVWRFLRVPGAGKGYPVVVAGGQEGDLPLTVASAPEIVRAAMANGVSLVIDLFDIHLTKADWKRIVMACVRVLLHENQRHGLRHVFIEEAAEFCPQRVGPDQGQVYAEIEKLARMGGNARLGYTLINQRAEEVNKAVLELCDNLFLHRQKGRNSLTALSKWLDIGAVKDHAAIIDSLSTLPTGECWAWLTGTERPVLVKVPTKQSLHPDRRVMRGDAAGAVKAPVNVASFVETMRSTLVEVEADAKANDPAELKKRIVALERELAAKPGMAAPVVERVEVPVVSDTQLEALRAIGSGLVDHVNRFAELSGAILSAVHEVRAFKARPLPPIRSYAEKPPAYADRVRTHADGGRIVPPAVQKRAESPGIPLPGPLPGGERKILTALAQYPDGRTKVQVALLTGYAHNGGGFNNYISSLRGKGCIEGSGDNLRITDTGLDVLGDFTPLPTGQALVTHWMGQLGKAERLVLEALIAHGPMTKEQAGRATGYEPNGGGFNNALSRLRTLELIQGRGELRASEEFFS